MCEVDECSRPEADHHNLARLRPVRTDLDPEATVAAGNASGQNDGVAVCIVTHPPPPTGWG